MDRKTEAIHLFDQGANCAQTIVTAYCKEYNLDLSTAFKIAAPFGGGIGRTGQICGALTGALMVLGLKYGENPEHSPDKKAALYALVQQFIRDFEKENGASTCKSLLGYDLSLSQERERAHDEGLFDTVCTTIIKKTIDLLDQRLQSQ